MLLFLFILHVGDNEGSTRTDDFLADRSGEADEVCARTCTRADTVADTCS